MTEHARDSAAGRVYAALRAEIVRGSMVPGDVLSRAALADAHGVSQTPVREALLRLEREGLVDVRAQSKTVVSPIRVLAVHQAVFLRRALECDVVRRLASDPGKRDLGAADKAVEGDDRVFHRALFSALGMGDVFDAVSPLMAPLERFREIAPRDAAETAKEHCDILDRVFAKDERGAALAMSAHLASEIDGLGAMQAENLALFRTD